MARIQKGFCDHSSKPIDIGPGRSNLLKDIRDNTLNSLLGSISPGLEALHCECLSLEFCHSGLTTPASVWATSFVL
jgi:hypothetical protein